MKKIILCLFLLMSSIVFSQQLQGLEKIIVEKYYISNKADSVKADIDAQEANPDYVKGTLPSGSVTYRIYADLLPNFKLVSVYSDKSRNQKISFKTTTSFYNHPAGDIFATGSKKDIANSTLALDSYLTLGGAAKGFYGTLKKDDNVNPSWFTSTNTDGVLLNNVSEMGIPLTQKDGFIAGTGIQNPLTIGFNADVFGDGSKTGDSLVIRGGAYYTTGIVRGADTLENKILIAQVTTKGRFQFELNILIQSLAVDGRGQYYVAQNPQPAIFPATADNDVVLESLTYDSEAATNTHITTKTPGSIAVSVYPNPTNNLLSLEITTLTEPNIKGNYTIYGIIGNVIAHKELTGINKSYTEGIDISSLAKGLYTIQVSINGTTTVKKIIKN